MRVALAIALGCSVFGAVVTVAAARGDDWVGDRFAWRVVGGNGSGVQATVDGGRHWRLIFSASGEDVWAVGHTGPTTGVVSTGSPAAVDQFWTTDNGAHWYPLAGSSSQFAVGGHGSYLFWAATTPSHDRALLYQVRSWPPGKPEHACRQWSSDAVDRGLLCTRLVHRVRATRVASVPAANYAEGPTSVPGGTAVLVVRAPLERTDLPLFRLLLRRNGRTSVFPLPRLPADREAILASGIRSFFVAWPEIEITVRSNDSKSVALWRSSDGGDHWVVVSP